MGRGGAGSTMARRRSRTRGSSSTRGVPRIKSLIRKSAATTGATATITYGLMGNKSGSVASPGRLMGLDQAWSPGLGLCIACDRIMVYGLARDDDLTICNRNLVGSREGHCDWLRFFFGSVSLLGDNEQRERVDVGVSVTTCL